MKINNGIEDGNYLCQKSPLELNLKPYLCFSKKKAKAFCYRDLLKI